MRILLIEDDASVTQFVQKGLHELGHVVEAAADGKVGLTLAVDDAFDVIVVDRMLPKLDGLSAVKGLRALGNTTPVLFLSALSDVDERIKGLKAGGDDYLVKPFTFGELSARVEALHRRNEQNPSSEQQVLNHQDLEIDLLRRRVKRAGRYVELQPKEYALLELLVRNAGRVVTRTMLLEGVWGYHFNTQTNVIDVHVSNLRRKIDDGFDVPLIKTVRGVGYQLRDST